ncbi:MAG: alkaline phosphatase [Victivallaceae bacterium]
MRKLFMLVAALFAVPVVLTAADQVKYVFLFIGDGMSLPQRTIADEYSRITTGKSLLMNQLPVQGCTTTRAATQLITDSAASGTAIACGTKTAIGALGVDVNGKPRESIAETAKQRGKKVGILSSVELNHATPAAFYAHNPSRSDCYNISLDMLKSGFDFFGGGILMDVDGKKAKESKGNILELARKQGYTVTETIEGFSRLDKLPAIVISPRLQEEAIPYAIDQKPGDMTLADLTAKAIGLLDNPDGFFIMIEGGKIDWVGHANDVGTSVRETMDLDKAISVAFDFAQKHPDDTLIVVTGDHETGGLTVGFSGTGYQSYLEVLKHQKISVVEFNGIFGKLRDDKTKTFDDLKPMLTEYFGLKFEGDPKTDRMVLSPDEIAALQEAFKRSRKEGSYSAVENQSVLYGGYDPFSVTLIHLMANKAGVAWTSFAHTALPVVTSAAGKHAADFSGMTDNTDIANKIRPLL